MKPFGGALALVAPLWLSSCANPNLQVTSHSLAQACLGAAIGPWSAGSVTNVGTTATAGPIRVRWMLSADALPSTDDLPLLGRDADVTTTGTLAPGGVLTVTSPNIIVPGGARLGPQYLILAAVDVGATSAGVSYSASPITINQCPTPGACDSNYTTETAYRGSSSSSAGPQPFGRTRPRPAIVSDKSTLPVRGRTVGGLDGLHGLLLRYNEDRSFAWGKSLSHCIRDEVQSIATFNDGTLAVTSAYFTGARQENVLYAYSQAGVLLWQHSISSSSNTCTTSCVASKFAVVAVDPSDDTAIVGASDGFGGPVQLVRTDRYGNELLRKSYTNADLGQLASGGGPYDIATYRFAGTRSDTFLGFAKGAVLLDGSLNLRFIKKLVDLFPTDYPNSDVEVEICTPTNLYMASTGVEYFSGQDIVRNFDQAGTQRWAIRVQTGTVYGTAPAYTGSLGLLRPERFNLGCSEQDLPNLSFVRTDGVSEFSSDVQAITLLHTGAVFARYRGTFPSGQSFVGATGIDSSVFDFLALGSNKFGLRSGAALGWTSY